LADKPQVSRDLRNRHLQPVTNLDGLDEAARSTTGEFDRRIMPPPNAG
jgi:hypothetical protein